MLQIQCLYERGLCVCAGVCAARRMQCLGKKGLKVKPERNEREN